MCDRDESWANLNTYQTCLNYRGKMRYKNYSSKGGYLKQFIPYILENASHHTLSQGSVSQTPYVTHVVQSSLSSVKHSMGHSWDISSMIFWCLQNVNKNILCKMCPSSPPQIQILRLRKSAELGKRLDAKERNSVAVPSNAGFHVFDFREGSALQDGQGGPTQLRMRLSFWHSCLYLLKARAPHPPYIELGSKARNACVKDKDYGNWAMSSFPILDALSSCFLCGWHGLLTMTHRVCLLWFLFKAWTISVSPTSEMISLRMISDSD